MQEVNCYLSYLLSEAKTLTKEQITMLVWETIAESADTTLVTTEWAMYQLAKDPTRQVVLITKFLLLFLDNILNFLFQI